MKKCIFITSLGRSGSRFIGENFSKIINDAVSLHEPDILTLQHLEEWPAKFKNFGFLNMTVGKFIGISGLRNISNKRICCQINDEQIKERLVRRREKFMNNFRESVYIETNWTFYGVFDLLLESFPNSNSVVIIRDPRTWVQSSLNWGHWYHKKDWIDRLGLGRLNPKSLPNDPYKRVWDSFSTFEKLCWAWQKLVSFALQQMRNAPRVRMYKYEDLFVSIQKYENLRKLLEFVTQFPDGSSVPFSIPEKILSKVVHRSEGNCQGWPRWSPVVCKQLQNICGETMKDVGYGEEPEWKAKLDA